MSEVLSPIENFFVALPGGGNPAVRAVYAGGAGGAFAYTVKPSMSFDDKGNARPWILFDPSNPEAAIFPAWGFIVVPGVIFGLFL